jgi:hypothetical protein
MSANSAAAWREPEYHQDDHAEELVDCDLDENRNIVLRSRDPLKHLFNEKTSPTSMNKHIVEDSAQNSGNRVSTVDRGYDLI